MGDRTFTLTDAITNENGVVVIRKIDKNVGVCISLEKNGDVELFFSPQDLNKLIVELQAASPSDV